jgi:mRNA interferase YafQ
MRKLGLTPQFKRTYRKFVSRDFKLKKRLEDTVHQMEKDVFAPNLSTHSLKGELLGLKPSPC